MMLMAVTHRVTKMLPTTAIANTTNSNQRNNNGMTRRQESPCGFCAQRRTRGMGRRRRRRMHVFYGTCSRFASDSGRYGFCLGDTGNEEVKILIAVVVIYSTLHSLNIAIIVVSISFGIIQAKEK
jgi:hypothetical protein